MRRRTHPRQIPPGSNYFVVEVPDQGAVDFRLPFPVRLAKLTTLLRDAGLGDTEGADDLSKLDTALDVWMVGGAAIGLCWSHRDLDLDTDRRAFGRDLLSYGEAVLEELYDAGWSMASLSALYPALFKRISASLISASEVAERVGFSAPPTGADT